MPIPVSKDLGFAGRPMAVTAVPVSGGDPGQSGETPTEAYALHHIDGTTYTVKGYQQITDLSAAVGLTVPDGARFALIIPESQNVRWRDDGTNPTASAGMPLPVGTELWYDGNLAAIKLIQEAASAKANISYYA